MVKVKELQVEMLGIPNILIASILNHPKTG